MLNVYRASAGSGKTYQLTLEYIKLLLAPPQNEEGLLPGERQRLFRRILAVTFTNKATDEMKQRIVRQLDILAHDPESSEYIGQLLGRDGITADIGALKRQAAEQLYTLLHDFSGFIVLLAPAFVGTGARIEPGGLEHAGIGRSGLLRRCRRALRLFFAASAQSNAGSSS